MMTVVRGWLVVGGPEAAKGLPSSACLVSPIPSVYLPNAAEVEPGRWHVWQPLGSHDTAAVTLVCVDVPIS